MWTGAQPRAHQCHLKEQPRLLGTSSYENKMRALCRGTYVRRYSPFALDPHLVQWEPIQLQSFYMSAIGVSTAVDLLNEEGQKLFILMMHGVRRIRPSSNIPGCCAQIMNFSPEHTVDMRTMFYNRRTEIESEVYIHSQGHRFPPAWFNRLLESYVRPTRSALS